MENFKAVIFDMDGTMFDTETLQLKTWIAIGKKYNFNITEALVKSSFGISRPETKQLFLKALGDDFDFDYYRDMKERKKYESLCWKKWSSSKKRINAIIKLFTR